MKKVISYYEHSDAGQELKERAAAKAVKSFMRSDEFQDLVCSEGPKGVREGFRIIQEVARCNAWLYHTAMGFKEALCHLLASSPEDKLSCIEASSSLDEGSTSPELPSSLADRKCLEAVFITVPEGVIPILMGFCESLLTVVHAHPIATKAPSMSNHLPLFLFV
ncbi:hypothetical protein J5N97_016916 [Dioscorea zingiberensis]|uniref:Uncharacterized protein n=1 Tax=Dioscorea zingiberensis TaxID=325984 RepID=A0A9D5CKG3_9LILI|nr:hypothetical protein J5N97_016916 [Dioscorea zingiberensis]